MSSQFFPLYFFALISVSLLFSFLFPPVCRAACPCCSLLSSLFSAPSSSSSLVLIPGLPAPEKEDTTVAVPKEIKQLVAPQDITESSFSVISIPNSIARENEKIEELALYFEQQKAQLSKQLEKSEANAEKWYNLYLEVKGFFLVVWSEL